MADLSDDVGQDLLQSTKQVGSRVVTGVIGGVTRALWSLINKDKQRNYYEHKTLLNQTCPDDPYEIYVLENKELAEQCYKELLEIGCTKPDLFDCAVYVRRSDMDLAADIFKKYRGEKVDLSKEEEEDLSDIETVDLELEVDEVEGWSQEAMAYKIAYEFKKEDIPCVVNGSTVCFSLENPGSEKYVATLTKTNELVKAIYADPDSYGPPAFISALQLPTALHLPPEQDISQDDKTPQDPDGPKSPDAQQSDSQDVVQSVDEDAEHKAQTATAKTANEALKAAETKQVTAESPALKDADKDGLVDTAEDKEGNSIPDDREEKNTSKAGNLPTQAQTATDAAKKVNKLERNKGLGNPNRASHEQRFGK